MSNCNWKKSLVLSFVVVIGMVVGMCVIKACEEHLPDHLSYLDTLCMCFQVITTIGYGDHTPKSHAAKVFLALFALVFIPINFWLLKRLGQHILNVQKVLITKLESRVCHINQPRFLGEKCVVFNIIVLLTIVFVGAAIQKDTDKDWTLMDGAYSFIISLTTVGFGDLIPFSKSSPLLKVFMLVYMYVGLCFMSAILQAFMQVQDVDLYRGLCPCNSYRGSRLEEDNDVIRHSDLRHAEDL